MDLFIYFVWSIIHVVFSFGLKGIHVAVKWLRLRRMFANYIGVMTRGGMTGRRLTLVDILNISALFANRQLLLMTCKHTAVNNRIVFLEIAAVGRCFPLISESGLSNLGH